MPSVPVRRSSGSWPVHVHGGPVHGQFRFMPVHGSCRFTAGCQNRLRFPVHGSVHGFPDMIRVDDVPTNVFLRVARIVTVQTEAPYTPLLGHCSGRGDGGHAAAASIVRNHEHPMQIN